MNRTSNALLVVTLLAVVPLAVVPSASAQAVPSIDETVDGGVEAVQDLIHDAVALIDTVDEPGPPLNVVTHPGDDNDGDGRFDYYYVRVQNGTQIACSLLQSDFIWDADTAGGDGSNFTLASQDADGLPTTGITNVSATFMVYNPDPKTGAANCPTDAAPSRDPVARATGHVEAYVDPALHAASESNPTRLIVYGPDDVEAYRVEVFTRLAGTKNLGTHVVLRSHNPASLDASALFMTPFDLTNVHILSGYNLGPPPSPPQGQVIRHDFDDDDYPDIVELSTPTTEVGKVVNPLDDDATPADWDGDGGANADDPEPTTNNGLGWDIEILNPTGTGTHSGTINVQFLATKLFPTAPNIVNFTVKVFRHSALVSTAACPTAQGLNPLVVPADPPSAVLDDEIAGASATVTRTLAWDSHDTRFNLLLSDGNPLLDGRYLLEVRANNTQGDELKVRTAACFKVNNFDGAYQLTLTSPAGGEKWNATNTITWTTAALVDDPLPIHHQKITLRREHAHANNLHGNLHEFVIADNVPAANLSHPWDTIRTRIESIDDGDVDGGAKDFTDYKVMVLAYDDVVGANVQVSAGKTAGTFSLNNTPVPLFAAKAVADDNGFIDDPATATLVSGAANATWSFTPGRPLTDLRVARSYTLELWRCTQNAADQQGLGATKYNPDFAGTIEDGLTSASQVLPKNVMVDHFGQGKLFPCPEAAVPQVTMPLVNDGKGRVVINLREEQDWGDIYPDLDLPQYNNAVIFTLNIDRANFLVLNNLFPTYAAFAADPLDIGGLSATGAAQSQDAKFKVTLRDDGAGCVSENNPKSVTLGLFNATTGAQVASVPMTRSTTAISLATIQNHVDKCAGVSTPPWNSNQDLGVIYEATITDLADDTYVWNVTAVDRFDNRNDSAPATVVSANQEFEMGEPFDAEAFIGETIAGGVNMLEDLIGCDLLLDGPDDGRTKVLDCVLDNATGAYETVVELLETVGECDLDDDGLPAGAPECEDVVPILTRALNENITNLQDMANNGLPNLWGLIFGCSSSFDCPADDDLDGFKDAQEVAAGTDPLNPYSNLFDGDADLVLDLLESLGLDVNTHRIDWVQKSDQSLACETGQTNGNLCNGILVVLDSPDKYVEIADPADEDGYVLRIEESPGGLLKASTTQGGGMSWTLVDGLLDVDVEGHKLSVVANMSDGKTLVELTIDFDNLGEEGEAFLSLTAGEGLPASGDGMAQTLEVYSNPLDVELNGESVYETVYDFNQTISFGAPPPQCADPGPQTPFGTDSWLRVDRTSDDEWVLCFQVQGEAFGPIATPDHFLPKGGLVFDDAGTPVPWIDSDGDGSYDAGEEIGCQPGEAPEACANRKAGQALGCGATETLQACAEREAKDTLGCESTETLQACIERLGKEAAGCEDGQSVDECADQKATQALDCAEGETLQQCVNRELAEAQQLVNDLDGDGASNQAEINADSNPLYKYSTPASKGAGFRVDWDADGWLNVDEISPGAGYQRSDFLQKCSRPNAPNGYSTTNPSPKCEVWGYPGPDPRP